MGWVHRWAAVAAAMCWIATAASCGSGAPKGSVSKRVGPAGATVRGPGNVVVVVPPGAVFGDFTLTVGELPAAAPPLGAAFVATPIRLLPKSQSFAQTVEVSIPVPSSTLPAGAAVTDVVMLRGDFDSGGWVPVPVRSGGPGVVVLETDLLGDFAPVAATSVNLGACGDAMCNGAESCSICPLDCGLCLDGGTVPTDAGSEPPSPIVLNPDGTTATDPRTGLVWERTASVASLSNAAALAACASSSLAGLTWRLPTIREALTIIDRRAISPIWYGGLDGLTSGSVWTSTPSALQPTVDAWAIGAGTGEARIEAMGSLFAARCVSGTFNDVAPVLVDNTNGTVTDTTTGRVWAQAASPTTLTATEAQTYCSQLVAGGAGGFRLPTLDELFRLVRLDLVGPAIDPLMFPATPNNGSWTSTEISFGPGWYYYVWFYEGEIIQLVGTTPLYARCVR